MTSICGCSVDEVHREMETRFAKVNKLETSLRLIFSTSEASQLRNESDYLFTVVLGAIRLINTMIDVATCISKNF